MPKELLWFKCNEFAPLQDRSIIMCGYSGYIKPHDIFVISGYYNCEYRPLSPWLDSQSTCLSDSGYTPLFWCYLSDLELPNF